MQNKSLTILGIDPGYDRLGLAVVNKNSASRDIVVHSSCFQTSSKDSIFDRFLAIGTEIARILDEFRPDAAALETLFITKNQKTAMRVAEARGIIIYEAVKRGVPVFEYSPMQIKSAVTGDGTSDKGRMMKMVSLLVDIRVPDQENATVMIDDEFDAIAVALTHSAMEKSRPGRP